MNKEKIIPDPPAHIKKIIDDEFDDLKDTSEYPFSSLVAYRAGATFMYHRSEEELEERSVGFVEWINEKEFIQSENFWYEPPKFAYEGKYGICIATSTTELYKVYIKSLLTPTNGK